MAEPLKVIDIASATIHTVDEGTSVRQAALLMREKGIGAVVVARGGSPFGILTERDVLEKVVAEGLLPDQTLSKEIMTHPLITISAGASLGEASDLMVRERIRRLVVTDEQNVVGFLTQRDILEAYWTCAFCHKRISSEPVGGKDGVPIECPCGARYHGPCAGQVLTCIECSTKLFEIEYPEPEDTMAG